MKYTTLQVILPEEAAKQIKKEAEADHRKVSSTLRIIIMDHLKRKKRRQK